jgi:hypothetical protein
MLPETEKILSKFRELNRNNFYDTARDFVPADSGQGEGSYYGHFAEVEEIYSLMYTLHLQLDEQLFIGYYDNAYSSPVEPIKALKELNTYLKGHIERLQKLNEKYRDQLIPIKTTLNYYLKTQGTVEYVLSLPEVKNITGDEHRDNLKTEIITIKTNQQFKRKRMMVFALFVFYGICLFLPLVIIIALWNDNRNGKWFQLGLVLFPVVSFLYDRSAFIEIFKFAFSKTFRKRMKEKINHEVSNNYT